MLHGRKLAAAGLFALFGTAAACSFLLDTSENQCNSTADCVARGGNFAATTCVQNVCVAADASANDVGAPDASNDADAAPPIDAGPWGCLGHVVEPTPTQTTVNVVVPLIDLVTQAPVTGAEVFARVCAKLDVNCMNPLFTTQPDVNGLIKLTDTDAGMHALPAGFDGFLLVDPILPDGGTGNADGGDAQPPDVVVPSLVFFNPPLYQDETYSVIVLVKTSALGNIAKAEGATIDPQYGAIFMESVDCNLTPAAGVSVTIDSQTNTTQGFYFKGGAPSLTADSTDVTGFAGFINVSASAHTVTGHLQATQQYIGTSTVFTQPSMISYTVLAPSP